MKEALSQLFFKSIEILAPTFDSGIESGSGSFNHAYEIVPPEPDYELLPDLGDNQYKPPPLIFY